MEAPDFWNDPFVSQKKMQSLKSMKDDVATYANLEQGYEDIETMIEMGYEENDADLIPEIRSELNGFIDTFDMAQERDDTSSCHPSSGKGTGEPDVMSGGTYKANAINSCHL